MIKKILIISGTIFGILLLIFVFNQGFSKFKRNKSVEVVNNSPEQESTSKTDQNQKMKLVIEGPLTGAEATTAGKIIFYKDQKFYTADFEGQSINSIGAYPFNNLKKIHWATGQKEAIVQDQDGFYIYSLDSDSAKKTKVGADEIVWASDGRLFYKYYNDATKVRSLNISDKDGENWKVLVDNLSGVYRETVLTVQPGTGQNCFFSFPDGKNQSKLECVNVSGDKKIVQEGNFGADYLWSPDGQKALLSSVQTQGGNRMVLGVMNEQGGVYRGLDFPTTVQKCAWAKNSKDVYCAMMGSAPEQAILPNDWENEKFQWEDISFWRIDTETAKKSRILEAKDMTEAIDAKSVFLDDAEEFLFFQNRKNNSLYQIKLK